MSRKVIDCRQSPHATNCTLAISGEEDEVMRAAIQHAISAHGHEDNAELRETVRTMLTDEPSSWAPPTGARRDISPDTSARH